MWIVGVYREVEISRDTLFKGTSQRRIILQAKVIKKGYIEEFDVSMYQALYTEQGHVHVRHV